LVGGLGRWLRRRRYFGLWATAAATVLAVRAGAAARAQDHVASHVAPHVAPHVVPHAPPRSFAPRPAAPLWTRPSLNETGRVAIVDLLALLAPGARLQPATDRRGPDAMPAELRVLRTGDGAPSSSRSAGFISASLLEHELDLKFLSLDGCRIDVARRRRSPIAAIAAGRLTLRWTVLPGGAAAATEVVAQEPVDALVVDCVKRKMSLWIFPHPHGGAVRFVRAFAFRSSPFI
jgi:hypothetical protein